MLLAALLLSSASVAAAPQEINAQYQLSHKAFGLIGRVEETFSRDGDRYSIRSVSRSEGALKVFVDDQIVLESNGRINANGLQPQAFAQRRANTTKGEVKATFDWDRNLMLSAHGGEVAEVPVPRDTQDRISVMYQFMNLKLGEGEITIPMSNGRKVEVYTYRFVDEARLSTPAGDFDTVHFARVTTRPSESKADVWLAKNQFNLPVRVVFDDARGMRLEQNLVALQVR